MIDGEFHYYPDNSADNEPVLITCEFEKRNIEYQMWVDAKPLGNGLIMGAPLIKRGILATRNAFENNSAQIRVLEQLKSDNSKLLAKHEAAGKALKDINLNIVSLDKSIKDKEVAVAAYSAVLDSRVLL